MMIIERKIDLREVKRLIHGFPATAILGPRQCGKTFLSQQIGADHYFDLENPRDLMAFDEPQLLLEQLKGLIVIDEIQRRPDLFPVLRYLIDTHPKQKYLILGSASSGLLHQSSESLAGRIAYHYLSGLRIHDVGADKIHTLWIRGGLPRSFLAASSRLSQAWLDNYITTFLEKDIPQLGINISGSTLRRFWLMISHYHGQIINYSEIGRSFGVSDMTVRKYIDILDSSFMVRLLHPWHTNIGKRLVKRPKLYIRDSGIFHRLLSIQNERDLYVHPKIGASWESFALDCVIRELGLSPQDAYFWSTHTGAELDLLWQARGKWWGAEFKYSDSPKITKSMLVAIEDLQLAHLWIIIPGNKSFPLRSNITAIPLSDLNFKEKGALRHS